MEQLHAAMEPYAERMESLHHEMEPFHRRMAEVHREMEPFHRRMDELHRRLDAALEQEVRTILDHELGPLVDASAPLDEAAARVTEALSLNISDGVLRARAASGEIEQILTDLLSSHCIGGDIGLEAAAARAAAAIVAIEVHASR
jgi:hypothetical protein